jgi:hypothetical protein
VKRMRSARLAMAVVATGVLLVGAGVTGLLVLSFRNQPAWGGLGLMSALVIAGTALLFTGLFSLIGQRD